MVIQQRDIICPTKNTRRERKYGTLFINKNKLLVHSGSFESRPMIQAYERVASLVIGLPWVYPI